MQGAEVGVFEQVDRVVLKDLLKQEDGFLRPAACTEGSMALQYCLTNTSCARNTFVGSQCVRAETMRLQENIDIQPKTRCATFPPGGLKQDGNGNHAHCL
jgi:hypothetical protein